MNLKLPALCRKYFNKQKYKPHYKLYLIPKTNSLSEIIIFHMGTDSKGEVVLYKIHFSIIYIQYIYLVDSFIHLLALIVVDGFSH